jgi:hypothetical protein
MYEFIAVSVDVRPTNRPSFTILEARTIGMSPYPDALLGVREPQKSPLLKK